MKSLFNKDWNNDGEVDELDSAIDMMIIEDIENKSHSYQSSTDKANHIIRCITIPLFYLFIFIAPIVTIGMPFLSNFEEMKYEGSLPGYIIFVVITVIEVVCLISKLVKKIIK